MNEEEFKAWLSGVSSLDANQIEQLLQTISGYMAQTYFETKEVVWALAEKYLIWTIDSVKRRSGN